MSPRRRRTLTGDEVALWTHVTRHVAPISADARHKTASRAAAAAAEALAAELAPELKRSEPKPSTPEKKPAKTPGKFRKPDWAAANAKAAPPSPPSPPPPGPPLAPLERRLRQRLSRGSHPIDAVIDLHGMRQEEAHHALRSFLHSAQRQGQTVVLVVTGKGGASTAGDLFEERGVLRRIVPHWLRLPDLRAIVVGFEEAVQPHGGAGALYVRIRKRRGAEL
jgi:DNA-nicking Smr family endonuclease